MTAFLDPCTQFSALLNSVAVLAFGFGDVIHVQRYDEHGLGQRDAPGQVSPDPAPASTKVYQCLTYKCTTITLKAKMILLKFKVCFRSTDSDSRLFLNCGP
jgi:hypothetical protein